MIAQSVYLPSAVEVGAVGKYLDNSEIQSGDNEIEYRIKRAPLMRRSWVIGYSPSHVAAVEAMYELFGRTTSFLFRPPRAADYTETAQLIGVGDGTTTNFQLILTRALGSISGYKKILHPQTGHVSLYGGSPSVPIPFTLNSLGIVVATTPPANGVNIYADYLYDTAVRFDAADMQTTITTARASRDPLHQIRQASIIEAFNE